MKQVKLAIIGSGPSGYTAGVYASRAMLAPTLYAGYKSGGQLMYTTDVENYPGFPEGKNGPELMMAMREQAQKFGTEILDQFITAVDFSERPFKLWTTFPEGISPDVFEYGSPEEIQNVINQARQNPHDVEAESVIISTGATSIMLGIPGEKELLGRGVSTCAVCDAAFFKEKRTVVVGGGDSAMEDALALVKFASEVTIIHRNDSFKASKIMQERVLSNPKVKVLWNTTVSEVSGEGKVERIKLSENGQEREMELEGFFLAIGHKPMTKIFTDQVALDSHGYVITRQSLSAAGVGAAQAALKDDVVQFPSMTSVEGVFAAGDVVDIRYRQAVTAAGQGCSAAIDAERWIELQ